MRLIAILSLLLSAQFTVAARLSHITIISRGHLRFTVYLDGQRQNDTPTDSTRILNLTKEFYHLRIEFADSTLKPIDKKSLQMTDANGRSVDARYELRRNRKGLVSLDFVSQTIWPVWIDPTRPEPKPFPGSIEAAVQQRKASKERQESTKVGQTVSQPPLVKATSECNDSTLKEPDYKDALAAISTITTEEVRVNTALQITRANCITVHQLTGIMQLFSAEDKKVVIASEAYPHVVNKGLFFKVKQELKSDASFEKVMKSLAKW